MPRAPDCGECPGRGGRVPVCRPYARLRRARAHLAARPPSAHSNRTASRTRDLAARPCPLEKRAVAVRWGRVQAFHGSWQRPCSGPLRIGPGGPVSSGADLASRLLLLHWCCIILGPELLGKHSGILVSALASQLPGSRFPDLLVCLNGVAELGPYTSRVAFRHPTGYQPYAANRLVSDRRR